MFSFENKDGSLGTAVVSVKRLKEKNKIHIFCSVGAHGAYFYKQKIL